MPGTLYVILRHDGVEHPHFDLMFQTAPGSLLATWRAKVWRPTEAINVERLGDHRQAYLTFEGKLSGDRGEVRRVEQGICAVQQIDNSWTIQLHPLPAGETLTLRIIQITVGNWQLAVGSDAR
jgi:hypothetical protein